MRSATIALGLILAAASTGPSADAQCCRPYLAPPLAPMVYAPQVQMVPQTIMTPQIVGYQPMAPMVSSVQYRTPLRNWMFGRYRVSYLPVQIGTQAAPQNGIRESGQ